MAATDLYQDPNQRKKPPPLPGSPDAMNNAGEIGAPPPLADAPGPRQPDGPKPAQEIGGTYTGPAATTNGQNLGGGGNPQATGGGQNLADAGMPLAPPPAHTAPLVDPHAVPQHGGVPQPAQPVGASADPFASIGGGTQLPTGEWVPAGHPLAQGQPQTPPGQPPPGAPPGVTGDPRPPSQTAPAPAQTPAATNAQTYQQALVQQLQQAGTPASLADPALKAQADAYSVGQQRSTDQARSAMAERAAAEGGTGTSSGAFDQGLMGLIGQQGENTAGFNAGLVGDANKAKLQQMQSTLAMMGNDVNSEAGRQLQQHIADMQAQMQHDSLTEQARQANQSSENQRLGITTQGNLGQGDLALRGRLGDQQGNLGLLGLLLNNSQFGRQLDQQGAQFGAGLDQSGILGLLGMLGG